MEFLCCDLHAHRNDEDGREDACPGEIAEVIDMETASPAVSPSVVAAILMIQKSRVTSGTLLRASCEAAVAASPMAHPDASSDIRRSSALALAPQPSFSMKDLASAGQ